MLWFGGKVTSLTFVAFIFMVRIFLSLSRLSITHALQVISSVIAASSDVRNAASGMEPTLGADLSLTKLEYIAGTLGNLNVGYFWMLVNCLTSAAYVSASSSPMYRYSQRPQVLTMRKRITSTGFSDWDTMFYNNLLSIPILAVFSIAVENWGAESLTRNL